MTRSIFLLFTSFIFHNCSASTCNCGNDCEYFKGYFDANSKQCIFLANINHSNEPVLEIDSRNVEGLVVDKVLNGLTTRANTVLNVKIGYTLNMFKQTCLYPYCTETVYVSKCTCDESNWFETAFRNLKKVLDNHGIEIWSTVGIIVLAVGAFVVWKCFC